MQILIGLPRRRDKLVHSVWVAEGGPASILYAAATFALNKFWSKHGGRWGIADGD